MLKYVLGAAALGVTFVLYCCCRVASEADRRMEALYQRELERLRERRDAS